MSAAETRSAQPKGGMCNSCARSGRDCSALPFEDMPVIETVDGVRIVICTAHVRPPPSPWVSGGAGYP